MNGAKIVGLAMAVTLLAASVHATEWKVIRHSGRDYVTFQNVAEFYHFPHYSHANRTISLRSEQRGIRAQVGTSEIYINGVRFFTYFPLVEQANAHLISAFDVGKLVEPILRPSRIETATPVETVVLDPGHGGIDQGTSNAWGSEKKFALDVALRAREQLIAAGFKVEMTRSGDVATSLEERVDFANRFRNAVFVSIHFNSGSGGEGVESYALSPEGVGSNSAGEHHASVASTDTLPDAGNAQDRQNIALAAAVHASVLSRVSAFDRGVRHARFKVLRNIQIPAVLLEAGFLNDPVEGQRIATAPHRQQLAAAITQGVQSYNTAVNYRSSNATFAMMRRNLPPHAQSITEPLHADPAPARKASEQPSISISGGE